MKKYMELKVTWSRAINVWLSFIWRNLVAIFLASIVSGLIAFGFALLLPKMGYSVDVVHLFVLPLSIVIAVVSSIIPIKMILNKNYGEFRLVMVSDVESSNTNQTNSGGLSAYKKLFALLAIFLSCTLLVSFSFYKIKKTKEIRVNRGFDKISTIRNEMKKQIEQYFHKRFQEVEALSVNSTMIAAAKDFTNSFTSDGGKPFETRWNLIEKKYGSWLAKSVEDRTYYDLLIIAPSGDVVYTTAKEADISENVLTGKLKGTSLNRIFTKGKDTVAFQDFAPYWPSNNMPSAFIAAPIQDKAEFYGVLVLQLATHKINEITRERAGLMQTGEAYLVGTDKLMRSDSYLDPTNHSVKGSFDNPIIGSVNTEATVSALNGQTGQKIILDYNGNPVISAFTPLKIKGYLWALIVEIDLAEIKATKEL